MAHSVSSCLETSYQPREERETTQVHSGPGLQVHSDYGCKGLSPDPIYILNADQ